MSEGLGTKLRQLLAALDGEVQLIYDELGVPFRPRFYPIVQLLLEQHASTVGAVAEAIGVSQPAATQTINEMKRLGLVKTSAGTDRRARLIQLSPKGARLARRLGAVWEATHRAARDLEAEVPSGLHATIDTALAALRRRSFSERIRSHLEKT